MKSNTEFKKLVENGIEALPLWVKEKLENVAFVVEEEAPEEGLFGFYEGVPLAERGEESPILPDKITIYKDTILEAYSEPKDIQECVENTIWHEVAHYFGHDEDWVHEEEKRRGKTK